MADQYLHPTLRNIAPDLEKQGVDLDALAHQVIEDYRNDKQSRSEWSKMHARWLEMYYQADEPVSKRRWQGASFDSIPVLAEACHTYHTRAFNAMFSPRRIVSAYPAGKADKQQIERAARISQHMTWQLTTQNPDYKRGKDELLLALPIEGSYFTKTFRDPVYNRNLVYNVRPLDLLIPYGVGPRRLEDIERKTEVIRGISVNQTAILAEAGWLTEAAEPYPQLDMEKEEPDIVIDRVSGMRSNPHEKTKPCLLLESHRLIDLDDDGIAEPYIVTVDAAAKKVLRVAIRWDTDDLGNPTAGKVPVEYYTHYTFFPNPNGFYGLGLGHLIGPANTAVNKLLRQTVDAATLANIGNMSGFISSSVAGVQGGEFQIELGQFKRIPAGGDDIQKGIFQFKFPGPQQALYNALELLLNRADRFAQTTEAVTGQLDKVMQPTTVLALLDESAKQFSAVNERVVGAWNEELAKLYRLNSLHLDPMEYFAVLDVTGSMVGQQIAREDYKRDMLIQAAVDPQMKSDKERLQKAQLVYQFLISSPLMQNPDAAIYLYNLTRWFVEQMRVDGLNIDTVIPNPINLNQAALMADVMSMGQNYLGLPDNEQQPQQPTGVGGNVAPFPGQPIQGGPEGVAPEPNNPVGAGPTGEPLLPGQVGVPDLLGGATAATGAARSPRLPTG